MSKPDDAGDADESSQAGGSAEEALDGGVVDLQDGSAPDRLTAEGERTQRAEHEAITEDREKYDARKIVTGEARYTADYRDRFPDLAEATVVRSDVPHGRVVEVDTTRAEAMDGVLAVVTPWDDVVPGTLYSPSGQSYPEPSPWDTRVLREHVRFVGDPVAAVAAEDAETADRAARRIDVEYEEYDTVFDVWEATEPDAPRLFAEGEVENRTTGADYERNLESHFEGELGDPGAAFEGAADEQVLETEWETPYQSHCVPEPHTSIVYTDEDDRYTVITATQVPYHTRRQLSHVFDVPIRDVRVVKPRVGAGFGSKQEMVVEPVALALHMKTGVPVKLECTRREEFHALRNRHPMSLRVRTAVDEVGTPEAIDLYVRENSGAYGTHGMTVASNVATKAFPLYPRIPSARFEGEVVHTNLPMGAAQRGYGAPQGMFVVEGHMDELARRLGEDPVEYRKRHAVREGDLDRATAILKDGDRFERRIRSCGIRKCIERGAEAIGYDEIEQPEEDHRHRGIGMALCAQGSGVAGKELGAAGIRMNEDGSFVLQVGGVDVGSGNDTMFTQIAAEVLGCDPGDVVVKAADTDIAPFDYGAYASSTTYISGRAVQKAARDARERLLKWASRLLGEPAEDLATGGGEVYSEETGASVTLEEIGYESIYGDEDREQVMGQGHHATDESPPPFGAQFVSVVVDDRTGEYDIEEMVFAADCGVAINPPLVEGQIEGGVHMSYEFATSGALEFDEGHPETLGFRQYGMPRPDDQPPIESIVVETHEPTGPFGAKSIGELPTNGVPPALSNAIRDAVGVRLTSLPIEAEDVKAALEERNG